MHIDLQMSIDSTRASNSATVSCYQGLKFKQTDVADVKTLLEESFYIGDCVQLWRFEVQKEKMHIDL